jgi:hypothetical protein
VGHERQGLPLRLEAGDHLLAVHARLDHLQRHQALHGLGLLSQEDGAHAPFTELLQQPVGADHRAGGRATGRRGAKGCHRRDFEELSGVVGGQERLDLLAQAGIAGTGAVEEGGPLPEILDLQGRR